MKWPNLILRSSVTALTTLLLTVVSLQAVRAASQVIQNGGAGWSSWGGTWFTQPSGGYLNGYHYTFNVDNVAEAGATWASSVSGNCEVYAYVPAHSVGYRTEHAYYHTYSPYTTNVINQDRYPSLVAHGILFSTCSNTSLDLTDATHETYSTKYVVFDEALFHY